MLYRLSYNHLSPTWTSQVFDRCASVEEPLACTDDAVLLPNPPGLCAIDNGFGEGLGGGSAGSFRQHHVDFDHLIDGAIQYRELTATMSLALLGGAAQVLVVLPSFVRAPSWLLGGLLSVGLPVVALAVKWAMHRRIEAAQHMERAVRPLAAPGPSNVLALNEHENRLTRPVHWARLGYEGGFRALESMAESCKASDNEAIEALCELVRTMTSAGSFPLRLRAMQSLIRVARSNAALEEPCAALAEQDPVIGISIVLRAIDRRDSSGSYFNEMVFMRSEAEFIEYYGDVGLQISRYWTLESVQTLIHLLLVEQTTLLDLLQEHLDEFQASEQMILRTVIPQSFVPQSH